MADENDSVRKQGLLKKVKTGKVMYFVLHKDGASGPARLEYYNTKKDWDSRKRPKTKRIISLKTCFSVNSFSDSKVKYGLTLYTREDNLQVSFESEEERDAWLSAITELINTHRDARPMFPFVWDVRIRDPSLGKNYEGNYRLCLTDRTVIFVKEKCVDPTLEFPLEVIRRCGHTDTFFHLEVGRQATTGDGEFWMDVFDSLIAQNVHQAILACMSKPKDEKIKTEPSRSRRGKKTAEDIRPRTGSIGSQTSTNLDRHVPTNDGSLYVVPPYTSVSGSPVPSLKKDNLESNSYVSMKSGGENSFMNSLENKSPYMSMSSASVSLSSIKDIGIKPERGTDPIPSRHYSFGSNQSRPTIIQSGLPGDQYVEMIRSRELTDKEKSCSVPHLNPTDLHRQVLSSSPQPHLDGKPSFGESRTSSESLNERPRLSSLTQVMRPRSSTSHDPKLKQLKKSNQQTSKESILSSGSDYVSMNSNAVDSYVDMSPAEHHLHHQNHHQLHMQQVKPHKKTGSSSSIHKGKSGGKTSVDENESISLISGISGKSLTLDDCRDTLMGMPIGRRMSQPFREPFPELSASSEEEIGIRSAASSFSSSKSTSSSRSSLARGDDPRAHAYRITSKLDSEPYVDCQQQVMYRGSTISSTHKQKPERVASFISEEPLANQKATSNLLQRRSSKSSLTSLGRITPVAKSNDFASVDMKASNKPVVDSYVDMTSRAAASAVDSYMEMQPQNPITKTVGSEYMEMNPSISSSRPPDNSTETVTATNIYSSLPNCAPPITASATVVSENSAPCSSASSINGSASNFNVSPAVTADPVFKSAAFDPYMDMTPVKQVVVDTQPKKQESTPLSNSKDDPYLMMDPVSKPSLLVDLPRLPSAKSLAQSDSLETLSIASKVDSQSEASTLADNMSSTDSNSTLMNEGYSSMVIPAKTEKKQSAHSSKTPKAAVCYLRLDSQDNRVPEIKTQCYIRSDSYCSQISETFEDSSDQNNILNDLASYDQRMDSYGYISFPPQSRTYIRSDSTEVSTPLSPIKLPTSKPSFKSSRLSTTSDIPSSAAELQAIQQSKQRRLFDLPNDERPTSFIKDEGTFRLLSSVKSEPTQAPPEKGRCLIETGEQDFLGLTADDAEKLLTRKVQPPVPALPPRRSSDETTKIKRNSSDPLVDKSSARYYAELDHSQAPMSPTPKPEGMTLCLLSNVDYTEVDHKKTEQLSKKNSSSSWKMDNSK